MDHGGRSRLEVGGWQLAGGKMPFLFILTGGGQTTSVRKIMQKKKRDEGRSQQQLTTPRPTTHSSEFAVH